MSIYIIIPLIFCVRICNKCVRMHSKKCKEMDGLKKILSAVLCVCMVFGLMAVGFTAQAATGADLQAGIDAAIANHDAEYTWTGGDVTLDEPLEVYGDIKVNFGNATIDGAEDKSVVFVNGGATLANATFVAHSSEYYTHGDKLGKIESLLATLRARKSAIIVQGGNVTLDGVIAIGSLCRVTSVRAEENRYIPISDGIEALADAALTIKNTLSIGLVALNNMDQVTIEDCALFGLLKDIQNTSKVTYAAGTARYNTFDVLEEILNEKVTLTEDESEYVGYFTSKVLRSTVSVVEPNLAETTSEYANGILTVTAKADDANSSEHTCGFYYSYVPKTCTIGDETVSFVKSGDDYIATFNGIEAGTAGNYTVDYALHVNVDSDKLALFETTLAELPEFVENDLPALLNHYIDTFDKLYAQIYEIVETIYNTYNGLMEFNSTHPGTVPTKLIDDFRLLIGQVYTLCGMKLDPNWSRYNTAQKNYYINKVRGSEHLGVVANNGDGILDRFDVYYNTIKGYAADFQIKEMAEYVGDNYLDIYQLVKDLYAAVGKVNVILSDPESDLAAYLADIEAIGGYLGYIGTIEELMGKVVTKIDNVIEFNTKYQSIVEKYDGRIGEFCGIYAQKALKIATHPDAYFTFDIDDEGINFLSFEQTAAYEAPEVVEYVTINVSVSGDGQAVYEGEAFSAAKSFLVEKGATFTVSAVENALFQGFYYTMPNTEWKFANSFNNIIAGTDMTITVAFGSEGAAADGAKQITFLTDANFSNLWIGSADIYEGDDIELPEVPTHKNVEFKGWSLNMSCAPEDALSDEAIVAEIEATSETNFVVYAIYDAATEIETDIQDENATLTSEVKEGKVYFDMNIQVKDGFKAIQAGVIATKNAALANEADMTVDLIGTSGVIVSRVSSVDGDGYVLDNLLYSYGVKTASGTVYGRGYIVLKNMNTGEIVTEYTGIYNGTI